MGLGATLACSISAAETQSLRGLTRHTHESGTAECKQPGPATVAACKFRPSGHEAGLKRECRTQRAGHGENPLAFQLQRFCALTSCVASGGRVAASRTAQAPQPLTLLAPAGTSSLLGSPRLLTCHCQVAGGSTACTARSQADPDGVQSRRPAWTCAWTSAVACAQLSTLTCTLLPRLGQLL